MLWFLGILRLLGIPELITKDGLGAIWIFFDLSGSFILFMLTGIKRTFGYRR